MPSIIEGYSYDIFISYRQNDNKYDGWVTEFVDNLNKELEANIKDKVSVYFDINPTDGLLETDLVDKSLGNKLKCLIFIPIISRTYCDSKSFAWQHEFCAFNKRAKEDRFGRDIKLSSGNVASRILPVKIHDLDPEDKALLENELGGIMRGIEFIYKEHGVNRPLKPDDDEKINLNKTKYRNQINKVANAIKEVITAIKQHGSRQEEELQEEVKPILSPRKNHKTAIIAGLVSALVLIILGFIFVSKLFKPSEELEKSIAVLPFINESPVDTNKYFINGVMEEVLSNLMKIKDFRVLSRTSTDQYRGPERPPITEIARRLDVNYIVEGSGQKYGNNFILRVQLIKAKGKEAHMWANSYKQEIREVRDYIEIPSQIAQAIAAELKAVMTPADKQLIEKIPTTSLAANEYYLRGNQERSMYSSGNPSTRVALNRAEKMYKTALDFDSTFARAYLGLAWVYGYKHYLETYISETSMDSVLILANIALRHDNQLSEAYVIKGMCYSVMGNPVEAITQYDKAIEFNPNEWQAYSGKGSLYFDYDFVKSIENYQTAISLNQGPQLPDLLRSLGNVYSYAGFTEKAKYYYQEALSSDMDSLKYYQVLQSLGYSLGNYAEAIEFGEKAYAMDTSRINVIWSLGEFYMHLHQYQEALKYFKKWLEKSKTLTEPTLFGMHRIGWAYWQNGYRKEAEFYFNELIKYCDKIKEIGRYDPYRPAYDLAGTYAFMGDKVKAYENLRLWAKMPLCTSSWITYLKSDPLFDSIRSEPAYQRIVIDMEAKYQAEHERVRKWLEEQGEL